MRGAGVAARTRREFRRTADPSRPHPVAENVLDREFTPGEPNASWLADVPNREGWPYLAVVIDLFSRLVAG